MRESKRDTDAQNSLLNSVGEGESGMIWENGIDAWGWCTGMTQRDGMGRELGVGGSGWGTRVHLWWMHVDIWQNQYNIVKIYINKKIKRGT